MERLEQSEVRAFTLLAGVGECSACGPSVHSAIWFLVASPCRCLSGVGSEHLLSLLGLVYGTIPFLCL